MNINDKNLVLVDTNFISLLLKHKTYSPSEIEENPKRFKESQDIGREILLRFYDVEDDLICISIPTIKEIYRDRKLFESFSNFFKEIPIAILKKFEEIIELSFIKKEIKNEDLIFIFSHGKDFKEIFKSDEMKSPLEKNDEPERKYMDDIRNQFEKRKAALEFSGETISDLERKMLDESIENFVKNSHYTKKDVLKNKSMILLHKNLFFKLVNSSHNKSKSDANDAMILPCCLPFVKDVYTEKSQAEFIKQMVAKNFINKEINVYITDNKTIKRYNI